MKNLLFPFLLFPLVLSAALRFDVQLLHKTILNPVRWGIWTMMVTWISLQESATILIQIGTPLSFEVLNHLERIICRIMEITCTMWMVTGIWM